MIEKKIFTILLAMFVINLSVHAQIKDATSSPSQDKEVQELKEKLASKVAELQKKEQRAVSGRLAENKKNSLTITANDSTIYTIKLDDVITKIYTIFTGEKKEIKVNELKKGDYLIASGPISDKTVTANYVYKDEQFLLGSGKITEVNSSDFFLKVLTPEKEAVTLDIETSTKKLLADVKAFTTEAVGFTKIKEGDTVHYVVKRTGTERKKDRYSATKILIIPQEYFQK